MKKKIEWRHGMVPWLLGRCQLPKKLPICLVPTNTRDQRRKGPAQMKQNKAHRVITQSDHLATMCKIWHDVVQPRFAAYVSRPLPPTLTPMLLPRVSGVASVLCHLMWLEGHILRGPLTVLRPVAKHEWHPGRLAAFSIGHWRRIALHKHISRIPRWPTKPPRH